MPLRALVATLLTGCASLATEGAPPVATSPTFPLAEGGGEVSLQLDADAVAQALPWEGRVVERTRSGAILFRDPTTFAVTRVLVQPAPATALGLAGGALYAGFSDGRVARVGPDGAVEPLATLSSGPIWVGASSRGPTAVAIGPAARRGLARVEVWTLGADRPRVGSLDFSEAFGTSSPTAMAATDEVLHLGWDWGEWGGALATVRFADASATLTPSGGIYGLTRLSDGVWAYGGMMHMGAVGASLVRLDPPGGPTYDYLSYGEETPAPGGGPRLPITNVLDGPGPGERTVLAYSDVYRVDPAFTQWRKVGELDLTYRGGRPDAVGTYPSVTSAWLDADRLVVGTRLQGLRALGSDGKTVGPPVVEGTGRGFQRVISTREGLVAVDGAIVPWRVTAGGLRALPAPWDGEPYTAVWDVDGAGDLRATLDRRDGGFSMAKDGDRTVVVWSGDEVHEDRQVAPARVDWARASDGALLGVESPLRRHAAWVEDAGRWVEVTDLGYDGYGFSLRAVAGPGRYFWLRDGGPLLRWVGQGASSKLVKVWDDVDHAVVADDGVYAAVDGGLVLLDADTGTARRPVPPAPPGLRRLAVDGCGRVWLAGATVGVLEAGRLRAFPEAPGLAGRTWTDATGRPEGVALTDGSLLADVSWPCAGG